MTTKGEKGHEEQWSSTLENTWYRLDWKSIEVNGDNLLQQVWIRLLQKSIWAHSMVALYKRDLGLDDCNGGVPQGALHKSLGCEQQPGHTLFEQEPGMTLSGVVPYSLLSSLASAVLTLQ